MFKSHICGALALGAVFTLPLSSIPSQAQAADPTTAIERGAYLVRVMDCAGCHTPRDEKGTPLMEQGLSGGTIGFEIPGLGIFWPSNLTNDPSGLADWSEADIVTLLRTGVRPDGRDIAPAMPWPAYAGLTDDDMAAVAAYLKSLPGAASTAFPMAGTQAEAQGPFYRVTMPQ